MDKIISDEGKLMRLCPANANDHPGNMCEAIEVKDAVIEQFDRFVQYWTDKTQGPP